MTKAITMSRSSETSTAEKEKVVTVTNPAVDAKVVEKLITARIGLMMRAPFFGNLATRLKIQNADDWLGTAATDGRSFYYNSEFVNKLSIRQTEFLFAHEVLHVVYDHMGRRVDRDPQIFNIAADFCVNQDIVDQKIGDRITQVQILLDSKYKGMSSEEVYDDLIKNATKISISQMAGMLLDEHLDGDGDDEANGDGKEGQGKTGKGRPRLTEEEKKAIRDEIKEAVISAAQTCGAGNLPAGVKRLIGDITEPKINWKDLIHQQILSTIKEDSSFSKPSRKAWHMDSVLPGSHYAEMIDICVSVDLSGSIGAAQCKAFFNEIHGIMQMYSQAFKIHVWTFDTQVYNPQVFTQDNIDEIFDYVPQGGGGTTFECNWEYMKDNDIEPKKFIMFTDGYPCGAWCPPGDENYCDTVFIIHGSKAEPPFGTWAYFSDEV